MTRPRPRPALTLLELMLVVTMIALLAALLLPSLEGGREQARRAYCLANLRGIGLAAASYATEDRHELLIPIHRTMITYRPTSEYWLWRTAMWFSFGGNSGARPFRTDHEPRLLGDGTEWAAETRPLSRHLFGSVTAGARELTLFRCPSDRGYPDHADIDDSPRENAEQPCFETLGSSYRASLFGIFPLRGSDYDGAFAVGPWGHRLSTITDPARVAAFGEPTFFNMIGRDDVGGPNPDAVLTTGWHKRVMTDNLALCDGSARPTRASGHRTVDPEVAQAMMQVGPNWDLLSRGPTWRFDLWPTPGARIWSHNPEDQLWNPGYTAHPDERWRYWPFVNAQDNLRSH